MSRSRREVDRLEATILELRSALEESWRRRGELTAEAEALRTENQELQERAALAPSALVAEREALRRQIDDLLSLRARIVTDLRGVSSELDAALERLGESARSQPAAPAAPSGGGRVIGEPAAVDRVYDGRVRLEVESLHDFVAISSLERALIALPGIADVHVRRVEGTRSIVDVELQSAAPVLRAMDGSLPFDLSVTGAAGDAIELAVRNAE